VLQGEAVARQGDGKILVAGYGRGRLDRSFGEHGRVAFAKPGARVPSYTSYFAAPFAVDQRGRIVLAVPLFPEGSEGPIGLLRLLPDGRRDRSFGRSRYMERAPIDGREPSPRERGVKFFNFEPQAVAIDGRGRIVVTGGESAPYTRGQVEPGHEVFTSRRFLVDGRRDKSFGEGGVWDTNLPGSQSMARAALTQPDSQVVGGGSIQIERGEGNGPGNTAMLFTRYR